MSRPTIKAIGPAHVVDDGLTLAVPIALSRRSQRRRMAPTPAGEVTATEATSLQRALARAHRWLRMLDSGEAASILDIAQREGEDRSYVGRMLNLTVIAPDIVALRQTDRALRRASFRARFTASKTLHRKHGIPSSRACAMQIARPKKA